MNTEEALSNWLRRPEKTYLEQLQFALKAWQSAELTLASKYDVILNWLAEVTVKHYKKLKEVELPELEFKELFQLRAQPGLIAQETKHAFVQMWLEMAELVSTSGSVHLWPELLRSLVDWELLQDYFRANYEIQTKVYGKLLHLYEQHLQTINAISNKKEDPSNAWQPTQESVFFAAVINSLKDSAKRSSDQAQYDNCYTTHILQPLGQVLLLLRSRGLCYFDELQALERLLCEQYKENALLQRILQLPLHVRLLTLECAMVNLRGVENFLRQLLQHNFHKLLDTFNDTALGLTVAAYTLEMLRKHDISLLVKMSNDENALNFLGGQIFNMVEKHRQTHLREVLMLLCAALRLNPLILEQHVFQVTTWLILQPKGDETQLLYEEYLVLLMDMFRRLSRAEKFVSNLLKCLNESLENTPLQTKEKSKGKRKGDKSVDGETPSKKSKLSIELDVYLEILFKDFYKLPDGLQSNVKLAAKIQNFPDLLTTWPSASVGLAFSKVVTGLMSKPSVVVWKCLLYALQELLTSCNVESETELTETKRFQFELHAALLCQYFNGCKLTEQYDKFQMQIDEQRRFTGTVMAAFGRFLLSRTHDKRIMNAFLECCYHAGNFELVLAYYCPDGMKVEDVELHSYLTKQEWTLIEQRIWNFGVVSCKTVLQRLQFQREEAITLFNTSNSQQQQQQRILSATMEVDASQWELLLQRAENTKWLIARLNRAQKLQIINLLKPQKFYKSNSILLEDMETVELIALCLFAELSKQFAAASKKSLLGSMNVQCEDLMNAESSADKQIKTLATSVNAQLDEYNLKKFPQDEAQRALNTLEQLPVAQLRRQSKSIIFVLLLALYRDLEAAQAHDMATQVFQLLTALLHFGQQIPIFKHFPMEAILSLFPVARCWQFYEFIFASIRNEDKYTDRFLQSLISRLESTTQSEKVKLPDDDRRLLLLTIETLAGMTGPSAKRLRKQLNSALIVYAVHVQQHFDKTQGENVKKDKKFVEKTLAGFAPYANSALTRAIKEKTDKTDKTKEQETSDEREMKLFAVDEQFRRVCKVYIGHSMDYRNPHAIRLMQVALNHRQALHLDQDEIEFVLSGYWRQLNADLSAAQAPDSAQNTEAVIKLIIGNKTNEDFLLTLKDVAEKVATGDNKNVVPVTQLMTLIAKCPLSTIKGAIFNEQFRQITYDIILHLERDERQQFTNTPHVLNILTAQQAIVEHKIPLSSDTLDSILGFLIDINIKKFIVSDTNVSTFQTLHSAMTDVCMSLIKHRHGLLMDRVPQYLHIFKDLLQSIVWYKSERQKDVALPANELDQLAELTLKLTTMTDIIASHSVGVKRVAPFVLTFVINLMVGNKRPTTLYTQIKTHIESICHSLLHVCDHRVGRFILRASNEAARQVYELLVKEHKKYHKFKGKV